MVDDLQNAIALLKAGKKAEAGNIFARLVKANPNNEQAWFGLSSCVTPEEQKKYCLNQVLQINPQNQHAKKNLANLDLKSADKTESQNPKPAHPSVASQGRVFFSWLIISFIVVAIVVVVVGMFSIWKASIPVTNSTPGWGLEALPSGSSLKYNNWSIRVDGIVTKQTVEHDGNINYPQNGRFAVVYFSVTNIGTNPEIYVPASSLVIMDSDKHIFPVNLAVSAEEAFSRNWKFGLQIRPGQNGTIMGVYDISLSSKGYLLLVLYANTGVLLDMPP